MRVLIEQYSYATKDLEPGLRKLGREKKGKTSWDEVGYFLSSDIHDCVFILPKVLLWTTAADGKTPLKAGEELVLGKYTPEEFIRPEKMSGGKKLSREERQFIYGFSTWIYRALKVFKRDRPDSDIILEREMPRVRQTGKRRKSETLLDVLLSIEDFARENRDFFFFVVKNSHSGLNKINWTRTIAKSVAIIQDDVPLYLNPVNKRRQINFDEELLVIFFSILNYMNEKYGFTVPIELGYEPIAGAKFRSYVEKGLGKRRLLAIKYKYFSDKALRLWDLCYAFFESEHRIYLKADHEEYLLAKKFDRVFEAMIDKLVGDPKDKLPRALTKQDDGKEVDHMYLYKELVENRARDIDTFYIGDSKYYKQGTALGREAVYKQFTYARNVIQWRLNLFMSEQEDEGDAIKTDRVIFKDRKIGPVRDEVTEGYEITPNFFISAMMGSDLRAGFKDDSIFPTKHGKHQSYVLHQFENRLFDRDTLIVAHYDVNFLFVLSLYAQDRKYRQAAWKSKVRHKFREEMQKFLSQKYKFYAMTPKKQGIEQEFLASDFKRALGKVYKPFATGADGREYYSLALELADPEHGDSKRNNAAVKAWLEQAFHVEECSLGDDPEQVLQGKQVQPADGGRILSEELAVKSRYEQVSLSLFKTIEKTQFYVARYVANANPAPSDIKRVFLFTGEPKALTAIADLQYVCGDADKAGVIARVRPQHQSHVAAMCSQLLQANPQDHFDLWKVTRLFKVV